MTTSSNQVLRVVRDWHTALNTGDTERLATLVDADLEIGGPRGSATGVSVLLDWVERASVRLLPRRYFCQNEIVVVEEMGEWHAPETGEVTSRQVVASVFVVKANKISRIVRYDALLTAFAATGLDESAAVK